MLNMIISILGNSFDEFQLKSEIIDYKEMTEFIFEIEQIKALFKPIDKFQYLHICSNPYEENNGNWGGRVMDSHKMIANSQKEIEDKLKESEAQIEESFLEKINSIDYKFCTFDQKINDVQGNIKVMNAETILIKNSMAQLESKLDLIIASLNK